MRSRQLNLQIVFFSLFGLLLACLSASLIVRMHVFSPRMTIVAFTSNPDAEIQGWYKNVLLPVQATRSRVRGNRRLANEDEDETSSSPDNNDNEATLSLPSEGPTVIIGQIFPITPDRDSRVQQQEGSNISNIETHTVPSIMVGLASAIIVCAALLYFHDLRDRFRGNHEHLNDNKIEGANIEGNTSAGSTSHEGSTYWINTPSTALPPMASPEQEDNSLSRVSTLTASMIESAGVSQIWSFSVDEKLQTIDSSSQVTELSDEHLVPKDTALTTLMKSEYSSSSNDGDDDEDSLLGENCLPEEVETFEDSPRPSFECTPEKHEERNVPSEGSDEDLYNRAGPVQLEELLSRIPFEEMSNTPSVVRDIYFFPNGSKSFIGVKVQDNELTGYPKFVEVDNSSPLTGRIFAGDTILSLNDIDGAAFTAEETLSVLRGGTMVKMTVRSVEPELLSSDISTSTIDLNDLENIEEI
mmetsp:Transcript_20886/g.30935  ORF Transcript_20886/g.30935 Transcript_20886/m.30935 type:complete len:470 (-) Transcript_20886:2803-4212(-)